MSYFFEKSYKNTCTKNRAVPYGMALFFWFKKTTNCAGDSKKL